MKLNMLIWGSEVSSKISINKSRTCLDWVKREVKRKNNLEENRNHRQVKRKTHGVNFTHNLHTYKTSMESKPSSCVKRSTKRMAKTYVWKERKLWRTMEKLKSWKPLMMENRLKRSIISLTKKVKKLKRLNKSKIREVRSN